MLMFSTFNYWLKMLHTDPTARAELIESIHQPWKATLAGCLSRWSSLDPLMQAQSYLVIQDHAGEGRR
jgi:hypothetical protein